MPRRATDQPAPPPHLSDDARTWWEALVVDYDFSASELRLLQSAAEAWDRQRQAREAIAEHGMVYYDRFGAPRARPEVGVERDSRLAFARLLREMNLDAAGEPGRPPRIGNRYART